MFTGLELLSHPQLYEVLFPYLEGSPLLKLRLGHRSCGELVVTWAGSELQDALRQELSTGSDSGYEDFVCEGDPRTIDAALVRLLVRCGEFNRFLSSETSVRRSLSSKVFCGQEPKTAAGRAFSALNAKGLAMEWVQTLTHLDVSRTNGAVDDRLLKQFLVKAEGLQVLNVSQLNVRHGGKTITDASLMLVATHCRELRWLNVSHNYQTISDKSIIKIVESCLHLEGLDVSYTEGFITDASIREVAMHSLQLKSLKVGDTRLISDASMILVANSCTELESLDVSRTLISDASLKVVAANCKSLQHVKVASINGLITDDSMMLIAENCPQLKSLQVGWVCADEHITDASLKRVFSSCRHLQHVDVSYHKSTITDKSIQVLANCPELLSLNVRGCNAIRDESMRLVALGCPQLQSLNVMNVTDECMSLFGFHCPQLTSLDVSASTRITDESLNIVMANCHQLRYLNISNTCASVELLRFGGKQLRHLDVSYMGSGIDDEGILLIGSTCHQLRALNIRFTSGSITMQTMAVLARRCPHLEALDVSGKIIKGSKKDDLVKLFWPCSLDKW